MALSFCILLKGITSKHGDFYCLNCFILLEQKLPLKNMKVFAKTMTIAM